MKHSARFKELMKRDPSSEKYDGMSMTDEEIEYMAKEDLCTFGDKFPAEAEWYMDVLDDFGDRLFYRGRVCRKHLHRRVLARLFRHPVPAVCVCDRRLPVFTSKNPKKPAKDYHRRGGRRLYLRQHELPRNRLCLVSV